MKIIKERIKKTDKLFLGKSDYNDYVIVCKGSSNNQGIGSCMFLVDDYRMSNCDGAPQRCDGSFVEVGWDVVTHSYELYNNTEDKMAQIGEEGVGPITRELTIGDCIYCQGVFLEIEYFAGSECVVRSFYFDGYSINIDMGYDTLDEIDFTLEELKTDGHYITKESFSQALSVAKDAITQVRTYLGNIYEQNF